jgi:S1-C subfamily serine protease
MRMRTLMGLALGVWLLAVVPLVAQIPERPPRASVGIAVEPTPMDADPSGVVIRQVTPSSPAAKAGMKRGDVIVKVGDKDIADFDALVNTLAIHKPGDKLTFQVLRNGKEMDLAVTLGEGRPEAPTQPGQPAPERATAFLGVQTRELTPDVKDQLVVKVDKGAVVTEVVPNTPAERAGLKPSDVITRFNGQPIANPAELRDAVHKAGIGKKVTFQAARGKDTKEFAVELEEAPGGLFFHFPRGNPLEGVLPGPVPGTAGPEAIRVQELERKVRELEKRIRELEDKGKKSGG